MSKAKVLARARVTEKVTHIDTRRRIRCRWCKWTTAEWYTNSMGYRTNGYANLSNHVFDSHPEQYHEAQVDAALHRGAAAPGDYTEYRQLGTIYTYEDDDQDDEEKPVEEIESESLLEAMLRGRTERW